MKYLFIIILLVVSASCYSQNDTLAPLGRVNVWKQQNTFPQGIVASTFAKIGGLSTQFLLADGSVFGTTGTPSATTYLRGDGAWATVGSGGTSAGLDPTHPVSTGGTPTITISSGAAAYITSMSVTGHDLSMQVVFTVSGGTLNGTLATITFASAWSATPYVVYSIATSETAGSGATFFANATSTTSVIIGGFNIGSGRTYTLNLHTIQ